MKSLSLFGICICMLSLFSCVTPHLGFPISEYQIPVDVTLFSTITKTGTVNVKLDIISGELWKTLYQKRYQDMLDKVPLDFYQTKLNQYCLDAARETSELFTLSPDDVLNFNVAYAKKSEDPKAYSGFDFSPEKESIGTRYILALTIDEWGFLVKAKTVDSGPYMKFAIRLIDKETNDSLWEHVETFRMPIVSSLRDTDTIYVTQKDIQEMYEKIIPKAVEKYFSRLRAD